MQPHDAERALVSLAESASPDALRISMLSESGFLALPADQQEVNRARIGSHGDALMDLARMILASASDAQADGRADDAERLWNALTAVGEANVGDQVTRLAAAYGRALINRVRRERSEASAVSGSARDASDRAGLEVP